MLVRFDTETFVPARDMQAPMRRHPELGGQRREGVAGARYLSPAQMRAARLACTALLCALLRLAEEAAPLPPCEAALARHLGGNWSARRVRGALNLLAALGEVSESCGVGWALTITVNKRVLRTVAVQAPARMRA